MLDGMDALARRFRQGDAEAFDQVFRRLRPLVHAVAMLEVRNIDDADDITQEVFRKALSRASSLDDSSRLRPWLLAITRHEITDRGRREVADRRKHDRFRTEIYRDRGGARNAHGPSHRLTPRKATRDPVTAAIRRERAERIRQMIGSLPQSYRLPVALRLMEDRSYREIAELLGQPFTTVKNSVARGGRMLIEKLRASEMGEELDGGVES